MRTFKFKIDSNKYEVAVNNVEQDVVNLTLNGKDYAVAIEREKEEETAIARPATGMQRPAGGAAHWGAGNVVHHERPGMAGRPNVAPGSSNRPESRPVPGNRPGSDRGQFNRGQVNRPDKTFGQGGQGTRPNPPRFNADEAQKLLRDRGFNNVSELRRALDARGLDNPASVKKALGDHREGNRDTLKKALSDKGFNPDTLDRSKLHDSLKNRIDIHHGDIGRNTFVNVNKTFVDNHPNRSKYWTNDWYRHHPGGWHPHHPIPPHYWWRPGPPWRNCWGWFTAGVLTGVIIDRVAEPIWYNYGTTVYYSDGMVYANGAPYVTAEEYYDQARDIASGETLDPASDSSDSQQADADTTEGDAGEEWMPFGTFAVLKDPEEKNCDLVMQLAADKKGKVAGNLVNVKTDKTTALSGAVDLKTQRVAFHVVDHEKIVAECGLANLTEDTLKMLVHVDKDKTEERTLVRLTDTAPDETDNSDEATQEVP